MRNRRSPPFALFTAAARYALVLAACLCVAPSRASDVCDRACLQGMVDRYLSAMIAHDPNQLPLSRNVRFTENGQELRIGDGLWGTASASGKYKLYVVDTDAEQVGFFGTLFEGDNPILLALRLRIEYGLISEIETIVARGGTGNLPAPGKSVEERGAPRAQFLRSVPERKRMSRADLVRVADSYFTGLGGNTGHNTAPFARTCNRLENGIQTTNNPTLRPGSPYNVVALDCEAQQKSGFYSFVTEIRNRRYPIVDRQRGLALAFAFFEHAGRLKEIHLTDGRTVPAPFRSPLTFQIAELFQIDDGKIDQIEAVLNTVPYGMRSAVWDAH
ncbi:MAG TPA: hypothetical protein VMG11_04555 [Steroidobacteraceae bacterium]|nr:hypothetical protein [Steroidobacteraceae bacterium]